MSVAALMLTEVFGLVDLEIEWLIFHGQTERARELLAEVETFRGRAAENGLRELKHRSPDLAGRN